MAPFKSEKQRKYLFMKKPKLAHKWVKKYGSKISGKKDLNEYIAKGKK